MVTAAKQTDEARCESAFGSLKRASFAAKFFIFGTCHPAGLPELSAKGSRVREQMIDVERSTVIARPPNEVFAYVSDLVNEPTFHTDVLESKRTSKGPVGVGTTYEMKMKPFRGLDKGSARVTRFEAGREIEFEMVMGKMQGIRTYRVEPAEGGTRVSQRLQMEVSGMMRVMSFMMRRMISKSWDGFLGNLKARLESEG